MIGSHEKQRRYNSTAFSQNQQYQGHRNGNNQRGINYHRDDRGNKNAQTQNVRQVRFSRPYQVNRGRNNGTPYSQISQSNFHDLPRDRYNPHAREFTPRDGSEVHVNNSAQQQREENYLGTDRRPTVCPRLHMTQQRRVTPHPRQYWIKIVLWNLI
jgi:hypothetical protein